MQDDDFYKKVFGTPTTTVRPFPKDDIELDDQAPLALVICIAAPVFIGFIILVLIYCFCRRRPPTNTNGTQNAAATAANTAIYHRAPEGETIGMVGTGGVVGGVGGSYPMTTVSSPYPGMYHPGPTPPSSQGYRMPSQPMAPSPLPSYPLQQVPVPPPPHFGGVPATYPPPQYPPSVYLPPPSYAHTHSLSQSSQASSASATTADHGIPSSPPQQHHPLLQQQHQQQQQQHFQNLHYMQQQQQHQQQQHHFYTHQQYPTPLPPPMTMQQQQQGRPGLVESPVPFHHHFTSQPSSSSQYPLVQSPDPTYTMAAAGQLPISATGATFTTPSSAASPPPSMDGNDPVKLKTELSDGTVSPTGALQPPHFPEQDLGYSDEEE